MSERPITTTLQALIDEEQERTASAQKRLGSFVPLVQSGIALLNTMVATVDRDHFMAAALMLTVQKSATLSFLSYIRGHIAQAEFNARQLIEFTVLTAYMLAHPEEDITKGSDEGGFRSPKDVSRKAYKWFEKKHAHLSAMLKEMKDQINDTTAHASLFLTHFNFEWDSTSYEKDHFRGSFFDNPDENTFRVYLMSLSRLLVIVAETLRGVANDHGGFVLKATVLQELHQLDRDVNNHRDILARSMGMGHILRK